jgi:hypothetical protein
LFTSSSDNFVAAFPFSFAERPPFTSQERILPAKNRSGFWGGGFASFCEKFPYSSGRFWACPPPPIGGIRDLRKYGKRGEQEPRRLRSLSDVLNRSQAQTHPAKVSCITSESRVKR